MAIEYTMRAVCDGKGCGAVIEPAELVNKTEIDSRRWGWESRWQRSGVMYGPASRFGKRKLYCAKCAGT